MDYLFAIRKKTSMSLCNVNEVDSIKMYEILEIKEKEKDTPHLVWLNAPFKSEEDDELRSKYQVWSLHKKEYAISMITKLVNEQDILFKSVIQRPRGRPLKAKKKRGITSTIRDPLRYDGVMALEEFNLMDQVYFVRATLFPDTHFQFIGFYIDMATLKYDLPLLDRDTRFSLWQVKMRAVLAQLDLDDALLGRDKMPAAWSDEEKDRKDRKALSHIHLHLSNNILQEVLKETTAASLWLKLEQICMTKDLTSKMHLKQKLFSLKMQEGGSLLDHLSVFKEIVTDLEAMEVKYDEEDLGLILLCSLPSPYSNFRDTILYSRDTLTLQEVYEALHAKEKMKDMVSTEGSSSKGESLMVRGRQTEKDNSKGKNSRNYRSKSRSRRIGSSNQDFDVFVGLVTDVRHVPGLKRNLISLSTLDLKGYKYSAVYGSNSNVTSNSSSDTTNLWHMRLGHMSELGLTVLSKRGLLDGQCVGKLEFCEHCIFGKHKRVKFNTSVHTTKGILDYVHSDLWGPSQEASLGGARYMLTIIDDFSRSVWPYFLKHKSEAFSAFKEWKVMVETQTGKKVKKLRTDNGMEFCSNEFNSYCKSKGIVRHYTIPHTPQQNGVVERMNRTIISKARCMLSNAGLSKRFWAEAASTAYLRIFGCPAYAHIDNGKLEPRAIKCIFLGYKSGVKGYKLWCPETKKVVIGRNVIFNESSMLQKYSSTNTSVESQQKSSVQVEQSENTLEKENFVDQETSVEQESHTPTQQPQCSIATDRPRRVIHPPRRLIKEANVVAYALNIADEIEGTTEPSTCTEAITSDDCNKWITAMHEEMESLEKNGTWELAKLPKEKKPIRCKWIFKRKEGVTPNEEARYKGRLVAKGYSQIPGIDFTDVFSPVVKHSSFRTLLSIVDMRNYELEQLDVKTAFLHGELEEDIYMEQPEGFIVPGKENLSVNGSPIYLLLYVDDMLIAAKDKTEVANLKAQLSKEFEMTDLGPAKKILGMEIIRERQHGKLYLSQKSSGEGLVGYVDSDYAGDLDKRRSLTGYVFTIGGCVSAIYLTKDQMFHERTKHIDVRYHFIRGVISQGDIQVQKISTHDNPADMMTKPVPSTKFEFCSSLVGEWLKFNNRNLSLDRRKEFRKRFCEIRIKEIECPEGLDFEEFGAFHEGMALQNLNQFSHVSYEQDDRRFTSQAWNRLFRIKEQVVREYVMEFLSSFTFRDHIKELDVAD
ncbi:retrotransposon protein, putative, ty1-copia subclass [Tanacetum coccineum]